MSQERILALQDIARAVAGEFSHLPEIRAISLTGSVASGRADPHSDIDLYAYVSSDPPVEARQAIIAARADDMRVNNQFWGTDDCWLEHESGVTVEVMYWGMDWIEEQVARMLERHEAWAGYSTCFLHSLRTGQSLYDPDGWLAAMKAHTEQPYPEALAKAIIAKNYPLLREHPSSYLHQMELAVAREDTVSINHRVAGWLAAYFDLIFALNRLPHPGEKRMLDAAEANCQVLPEMMREDVARLLAKAGEASPAVIAAAHLMVNRLDSLLRNSGS